MHIAHKTLIAQVDAAVVIERGNGYLTPGFKRTWYCDKPLFFYPFDSIRTLGAEAFVARLQSDFPRLKTIVVGYDFGFGKGREGDAADLKRLFDGEVVIVDEVRIDGISVHSRTIRSFVQRGDLVTAERLLGRRYRIDGEVIAGQGIGSRELVPTLNLAVRGYQLPAEGVYATRTRSDRAKEWWPSVSFIGHRDTIDGSFAIETHVLDRDIGTVTGGVMIEFVAAIRPNRRFETLEALREQIRHDIDSARRSLR
jgi:riboflavin kinase/FMN adenylyltransferase